MKTAFINLDAGRNVFHYEMLGSITGQRYLRMRTPTSGRHDVGKVPAKENNGKKAFDKPRIVQS